MTTTVVSYASPEEELRALQADNAALRSMLQRCTQAASSAPAGDGSAHAPTSERMYLVKQLERMTADHRREHDLRVSAQSLLAEVRSKHEHAIHAKEQEVRKLGDLLQSAKVEIESLQQRLAIEERNAEAARNELAKSRLAHHDPQQAPPEYPKKTPKRTFTATLRGMSPEALERRLHVITSPTKGLAPRGGAARSPSAEKSTPRQQTSPPPPPATPAAADVSHGGAAVRGMRGQEIKVGSRALWGANLEGIVRYVGTVHCLGDGTWVGLELLESGRGDHNGTLSGVRYFTAPTQQGIFCLPRELRPMSVPTPVAKPAAIEPPAPDSPAAPSPAVSRARSPVGKTVPVAKSAPVAAATAESPSA